MNLIQRTLIAAATVLLAAPLLHAQASESAITKQLGNLRSLSPEQRSIATAKLALDIRTLRKDMMSVVATGARDGVTMPLSAGVLAALSAAVAGNWGDRDIGELAAFLREEIVQRYDA